MTPKYFVKKIVGCEACNAKGFLPHPAWLDFFKKVPVEVSAKYMDADLRKWFFNNGWTEYDGDIQTEKWTDGIPPETIICAACEGEGQITSEVDLSDALEEVLPS